MVSGGIGGRGHLLGLEPDECKQLLRDASVGRLCWVSSAGVTALPVSYGVHGDGRLGVRVGAESLLAELAAGASVAFEVDDIDAATLTGWSVLVHGTARAWEGEFPADLCRPWAPGPRGLALQITPRAYSGRSVSAD